MPYRAGNVDIAAQNASFEAMEPTGDNHSFGLSPALLAELEAVAAEEHRSVTEVVCEALERYLAKGRGKADKRPRLEAENSA